jgi:beta-phosphoglucomutase
MMNSERPTAVIFDMDGVLAEHSPACCAVIEDAPVGIAAANAAGMASIGLRSTGRTPNDFTAAQTFVRSAREITPQLVRDMIAGHA